MKKLIILVGLFACFCVESAFAETSCSVSGNIGTYYGYGYDQGSALAAARDQCIQNEHNSYVCNYGYSSCSDYYPGGGENNGYNSCTVSTAYGNYYGNGYGLGAALASARDQCILSEHNSRVCNYAPYVCN